MASTQISLLDVVRHNIGEDRDLTPAEIAAAEKEHRAELLRGVVARAESGDVQALRLLVELGAFPLKPRR